MYKNLFPIFENSDAIFFDTAASAQKPKVVLDGLLSFYQTNYSNVHRGSCALANNATLMYENAREKVAKFLHVENQDEIVFTKGATESINLVVNGYKKLLKKDDEILVSISEHHANFVPWQMLAKETGAKFITFNVLDNGEIDINDFESKLTEKTKIVAVSHLSNVLGIVNPVETIVEKAHRVGARVLIDGAQSIAHIPVDIREINCDYFVFSGHKLYGPTGIGVLYGKKDALDLLPPYQYGGDMVKTVDIFDTTFKEIPTKFEAGTPPFAEAIALGYAIDFLVEITMEKVKLHEEKLTKYLIAKLLEIEHIKIIAQNPNKQGIVSFNVDGIHASDLALILSEQNICVRVGHHCAMPLHKRFHTDVSLRVSLGLYNNENDINAFIKALNKTISFFKR